MKTISEVDWDLIEYFSFHTSTNKHKIRKVIPISKLKKCIKRLKEKKQK